DLKPDNVFLVPVRGKRQLVKLLDFGIAKLVGREDMRRTRTCPDFVMGTPEYISPEQARGRGVEGTTDIYALGVMAYEMVLGRAPFRADSAVEVLHRHLHDEPPTPRGVMASIPPALEQLLLKMLAKDPRERPSLADIREQLMALEAALPATTATPPEASSH